MWWRAYFAVLLFALALSGCGGDDDDDAGDTTDDDADDDTADDDATDDDMDDDAGPSISAATFNAGLAQGYVSYADERVSLIGDALVAYDDADVLCLQEVWTDEDVAAIGAAAEANFPYQYRYDSGDDWLAMPDEPAPCADLTDVQDCAATNCDGLSGAEFTDCMVFSCITELANLPSEWCFACLAANIDKPLDDIVDVCTNPGPPPRQYSGENGVMLLSKYELEDAQKIDLSFFLITRVVLYAKVTVDAAPVHLFCTHLSVEVEPLPYLGEYDSFADENLQQALAIVDEVDARAGDETAVVMGDFNAGPSGEGYTPTYLDTYNALITAGLRAPFVELAPECTFCNENPLTGDATSVLIDHVLFSGVAYPSFAAERIFDEVVDIAGETADGRLSDHYGVAATLN